jgi:hypothetical protein
LIVCQIVPDVLNELKIAALKNYREGPAGIAIESQTPREVTPEFWHRRRVRTNQSLKAATGLVSTGKK